MCFSARYVPFVLFALVSFAVSVFPQTAATETSKAPAGTVSRRITIRNKGAAGVTVALRRSERLGPPDVLIKTTTDHDGFYRLSNVAAGTYDLVAYAPAFVMATGDNPTTKTVIVGADEDVGDIDFSLLRGGVITGKVTDADGRAVIQQQVYIYRIEAFNQQSQQRPIFTMGRSQTDDRGVYRIFGIAPGRYKVAAGRSDESFITPVGGSRASYKQVFHPDVTDQAKATIIEVSEGSEASNVDITLGSVLQMFSASGRVVDGEKGLPVTNLRFGLQRSVGQRFELVPTTVVSNTQGDFIAEGLIPGKYSVYIFPNQNVELRSDAFSFEISDQDVSGLTVRLASGATITGIVALENEDKLALQRLSRLQLRAFVRASGGDGFGNSSQSSIGPDGSFRLAALSAGTANFMLGSPMGPPAKGFNIARIERDGIVMPRGLEIKEGEQITGVRVIVSHGNAGVKGVVKIENGSLPEGARIFVRVRKQGENPVMIIPPQVDARGQFLIEELPPGIYELTVSITGTSAGRPRNVKREVSVQDGVVTDVIITIDMSETSKP